MGNTIQINIGARERACVNCGQYRRCWRDEPVPGEQYKAMIALSFGYCLRHARQCSPLRRPCRYFEAKEEAVFNTN